MSQLVPALMLTFASILGTGEADAPAASQALPRDAVEGLSGLPIPRYVSLSSGQANLRTGPGDRYPVNWVYQRKGLPLKVIKEYGIWREVEDPDGDKGWLHRAMISGQRTGMIRNGVQPLRARPDDNARIVWRAEPGVVGAITDCTNNWCRLTVGNRSGYVRYEGIWGLAGGESFE